MCVTFLLRGPNDLRLRVQYTETQNTERHRSRKSGKNTQHTLQKLSNRDQGPDMSVMHTQIKQVRIVEGLVAVEAAVHEHGVVAHHHRCVPAVFSARERCLVLVRFYRSSPWGLQDHLHGLFVSRPWIVRNEKTKLSASVLAHGK